MSTATADAPFSFDAAAHVYSIGGRPIPGVTQVLGTVLPGWQASDWHKGRGTALHLACQLLDEHRLDWSSVAPEIEPRVQAWAKFRRDYGARVLRVELKLCNRLHRYAGTIDRVFERDGKLVLCDLKSTVEPQVRAQLGGYAELWDHSAIDLRTISSAVAVELREDGNYRTLWLDAPDLRRGRQTFLACLTVFNFMQQHNLTRRDP